MNFKIKNFLYWRFKQILSKFNCFWDSGLCYRLVDGTEMRKCVVGLFVILLLSMSLALVVADEHNPLPPSADINISEIEGMFKQDESSKKVKIIEDEERKPDYKVKLKSREFTPPRGLSEKLKTMKLEKRIHVMIQFDDMPDGNAKKILEGKGIKLLDYLPENTYYASVPPSLAQVADIPQVRAVIDIQPQDKLSPLIRNGVSPHAKTKEGIKLTIVIYEDIGTEEAASIVEKYGKVIGVHEDTNTYRIIVPESAIGYLANEDAVQWIEQAPPPNEEHLDQARGVIGANYAQSYPHYLSGDGVTVALWDGGWVDTDHDDFAGRLTIGDFGSYTHSHSTHVAGIMAGDGTLSGISRVQRGVATNADIRSYEWIDNANLTELDLETSDAISNGALLSQNSWGWAVGGSGSGAYYNCSYHGNYEAMSKRYDQIVNGILGDEIVLVASAGNEENDGDCAPYPWGQLSPPICTAKNSICVGAIYSDTLDHTCFSSRGPTDDGRLKPDLVAPGDEANDSYSPCLFGDAINSTIPGDTYGDKGGTSMATPMVSGAVALMREHFNDLGYGEIKPHTYKAILIQTADDLGNPGPDYTYGHGNLDIQEAVDFIKMDSYNKGLIHTGWVDDNDKDYFHIGVPENVNTLKVTLAWDDKEGNPTASKELVNDLDLTLIGPSGNYHYAYKLDPDNPGNNATNGFNSRDNLEVVEVQNPQPGNWTVRVLGWQVNGWEHYTVVTPYEKINCGDTIYQDAILTETLDCGGDALEIGKNGVTLDCDNNYIRGDDTGTGIENTRSYVTIKDCRITNFDYGIKMHSVAVRNNILNNFVYSNDLYGIYLNDSWWNDFNNNYIYTSGYTGLSLIGSKSNDIIDNVIHTNGHHGIQLGSGSSFTEIKENAIWGSGWSGIGIDSEYNTIENNLARNNTFYGIHLASANNNTIYDNKLYWNDKHGIYVHNSTGNSIDSNWFWQNKDYGMRLYLADYNNITSNDFIKNDYAIHMYHSDQNSISDNNMNRNYNRGVYLSYSDLNNLSFNAINGSKTALQVYESDINTFQENTITHSNNYAAHLNSGHNNDFIGNKIEHNGGWAIYLVYSDNSELLGNQITHGSDASGIFSSYSNYTSYYHNKVCGDGWDWYVPNGVYSADNNTCDNTYKFNDSGQTACDWKCSGCRIPEDNLQVNMDMELCPGVYNIPDEGNFGVLVMSENDVTLECNQTRLVGNDSGIGIYSIGKDGNHILNCSLNNYNYGIMLTQNSNNNYLRGNTLIDNVRGIRIWNSDYNVMENNRASENDYGLWIGYSYSSDNMLNYNTFCDNDVTDIYNEGNATGNENTCGAASGYEDSGQANGCDWKCSGCRVPENDLYVVQNMTLCSGTYHINDTGTNGVLLLLEDGITLDCNDSTFIGDGDGIGLYLWRANNSVMKNCNVQNYRDGFRLYQSNNNIIEDSSSIQNQHGVYFSSGCNYNFLEDNHLCSNANKDVFISLYNKYNKGDENTCDTTYSYSDLGQSSGCDWKCSGCRQPENDLLVDRDMTLCPGSYYIEDEDRKGVIIPSKDNINISCDGTILKGDGTGFGVMINNMEGVTVENCSVEDYNYGIIIANSNNGNLINNTATSNSYGIYVSGNGNSLGSNSACGNSDYDIYLKSGDNEGVDNLCDKPDGWNDVGTKGCTYSCTPNEPPVASFKYGPLKPSLYQKIEFDASSSYDPDGTIKTYAWIFDDGNSTTEADPYTNYSYVEPKCYNVRLTVIDDEGLTNSTLNRITVGCGDVNCDGAIDISDVIRLLYYVGYPGQYSLCSEWGGDVNGDGSIDISDVIRELYYVGYPGQYTLECKC